MYSGSKYPKVPCTVVANCVWSSGTNLEAPKFDTFPVWVLSSNMFEDLTSLWIIGGEAAKCKYDSASVVSTTILRQVSHDMVDALLLWWMY